MTTNDKLADAQLVPDWFIRRLEAYADAAYVRGLQVAREYEALGWEQKMKTGKFGAPELDAHKRMERAMGEHFGIHDAIRQALAAHAASLAAPPAQGEWVMVPREPTSAMIGDAHSVDTGHGSWPREAWRRMLAAAPQPAPAPVQVDNWWRVEVSDIAGQIVAIELDTLSGREIGEHEEAVIREAIDRLRGFIGDRDQPPAPGKAELPPLPELPPIRDRQSIENYATAYARAAVAALAQQRIPESVRAVLAELDRATRKFPTWPTDPLHAVAVLGEEAGELTKAVLQAVYEPHKSTPEDVATEAIQTAAMALRFIDSLPRYEYARGEQHSQQEARGND